jgi:hypothetical protein
LIFLLLFYFFRISVLTGQNSTLRGQFEALEKRVQQLESKLKEATTAQSSK